MRYLKSGLAGILVIAAALLAAGEYSLIRGLPGPDSATRSAAGWEPHVSALLLVAFCICAAYLLVRKKTDPTAGIYCPNCRAAQGFALEPSHGEPLVSRGVMHAGGILLALLYYGGKQKRFRCGSCHQLFHSHTRGTRGYFLLTLIFVAMILVHLVADLLEMFQT